MGPRIGDLRIGGPKREAPYWGPPIGGALLVAPIGEGAVLGPPIGGAPIRAPEGYIRGVLKHAAPAAE